MSTPLEPDPTTHLSRRRALGWLGLLGGTAVSGCSGSASSGSGGQSTPAAGTESAALASLGLSSGTLSPAFDSEITSYTVSVTNATATLLITPTAAESGTQILVNGVAVTSGAASGAIALTVGATTIAVAVTAADGITNRVYSLLVNRAGATCTLVPSETEGPYPLSSVLADPTIVRSDIREGMAGIPLTLVLSLVDVGAGCTPVTDAAVYVWHCDKDGEYSGYSSQQNGNHLGERQFRGVQFADAAGQVQFTTVYPGWYAGRITHIHFQVFLGSSLGGTLTVTSQIAFPQSVTQAVYASSLYAARGQNTSVSSFAADNVFQDGVDLQLATVTGSVAAGLVATLTVGIST